MLRFTDRAVQALVRSDAAARRFNPDAKVRLAADPATGVRAELVDDPRAGDRLEQVPDGPLVIAEASLMGVVDAGEHDALTLTTDG